MTVSLVLACLWIVVVGARRALRRRLDPALAAAAPRRVGARAGAAERALADGGGDLSVRCGRSLGPGSCCTMRAPRWRARVLLEKVMLFMDAVSPLGLGAHAVAFLLPLVVSFGLARVGQVRAAWLLPAGLLLLSAVFVGFGFVLAQDLDTGVGAVTSVLTLTAAGLAGGVAGALLGPRRR